MGQMSKKDVARILLLRGRVNIHLNPSILSVVVPRYLLSKDQVILQISYDHSIPNLRVDDVGVYGTLLFEEGSFTCFIPWRAVFAIVGEGGRGMVWPAKGSGPPDEPSIASDEVVDLFEYRATRLGAAPPPKEGKGIASVTRLADYRAKRE